MLVWVALAGSAGALARWLVDGWLGQRRFPWATLLVNVSGSLLLGLVTGLVLFHGQPSALTQLVGVGFCGGYTTFSTVSVDTVRLVRERRYALGLANSLANLILTVAGGALGLLLTH